MNRPESIASTVQYGRRLLNAGLSGIRSGQPAALEGCSLSTIMTESAQDSLKVVAAAACVGLLRSYLKNRRGHLSRTVAYGALGSAVGFLAVFSWKTRNVAATLAHSAAAEMRKVSDDHWLELHPIDYA